MLSKELKRIATLFLKLGCIGFGGPAAHIAMMRNEVVVRKKWMPDNHFLDLVGATHLIPGPNSTEMAIHLGYEKGGWRGLILAGLCFILPAVAITLGFAWLYKNYGQLPEIKPYIYGIQPAIIAIILAAIFPLAKQSIKNVALVVIGVVALTLSFFNIGEIYILFGAGLIGLLLQYYKTQSNTGNKNNLLPFVLIPKMPLAAVSNLKFFMLFLKIGAILYGSGYVLFAFLDTELVQTGTISQQELIDAIVVGQFTPGPVFSAVTFIGYQVNGFTGAALATIGIFLPSFLFVALLQPVVKKLRHSVLFSSFLDAVNVASVAIIVVVCYQMGRNTLTDWKTIAIAIISLIITFGFPKVNAAFVILGSSLLGYLLFLV